MYYQNLSQDSAEIRIRPSALLTLPPGLIATSEDAEIPDTPESQAQPSAVLTPIPGLVPTSAGAETSEILYIEREEIFETVEIPSAFGPDYDSFSFYKVGTFKC